MWMWMQRIKIIILRLLYKMLDSDTLRPVIIGMLLFIVISKSLPKIIEKPTNITLVDEMVMMLISQQGFLMSGAILAGLTVLGANYINSEMN
jgi:hypothetical protein